MLNSKKPPDLNISESLRRVVIFESLKTVQMLKSKKTPYLNILESLRRAAVGEELESGLIGEDVYIGR